MSEQTGDRMLSRKFLFTVVIFLVASGFTIFKVITSPEWLEVTKWILLIYIGGNVAEKYAAKFLKK